MLKKYQRGDAGLLFIVALIIAVTIIVVGYTKSQEEKDRKEYKVKENDTAICKQGILYAQNNIQPLVFQNDIIKCSTD